MTQLLVETLLVVILVDFRALDTLGEIVVVAVAGIAGMVLLMRGPGHAR
jgi:multisubunit Na+/H+ antiporter MnhB subunit